MPMEYEDYLEHYGVKGMKWGVRRPSLKGARVDQIQRKGARAERSIAKAYNKGKGDTARILKKKEKLAAYKAEEKRWATGKENTMDIVNASRRTLLQSVISVKPLSRMDLKPKATDKAVTKRAKRDLQDLSDKDFLRKYSVTKTRYAKRVVAKGDPAAKQNAAQRVAAKYEPKVAARIAKRGR